MRHFDVFNGDADGVCALHQLRLAEPAEAELVTGVKRDIELLQRVPAQAGDSVTVLDVSLDRNRTALMALLEKGARVRYFDHHYAGEIPNHRSLETVIDTSAGVCTSILVDRHLGGRFRPWAVVAAFGDNLEREGGALAQTLGLDGARLAQLRELGQSLNYNAYGESESDLIVPPAQLYRALARYPDPLRFIEDEPMSMRLREGREQDLARALAVAARGSGIWLLPDEPWSRRVNGTLANHLAAAQGGAIAVLAPATDGGFVVSLRAPDGADVFCRGFPTGGGRRLAAGIDRLPQAQLGEFERRFADFRAR